MAVPASFSSVAVIGNGIIGHGIAQVFATAGKRVRLIGRGSESLARATARIVEGLTLFAENGLITKPEAAAALARIATSTDLDNARGAELVIEAVPEDMELKLSIF